MAMAPSTPALTLDTNVLSCPSSVPLRTHPGQPKFFLAGPSAVRRAVLSQDIFSFDAHRLPCPVPGRISSPRVSKIRVNYTFYGRTILISAPYGVVPSKRARGTSEYAPLFRSRWTVLAVTNRPEPTPRFSLRLLPCLPRLLPPS